MNRLTTRTEDGRAIIKLRIDPENPIRMVDEVARNYQEAVEKLARYEDKNEIDPETGLKPCPFCGGKAKTYGREELGSLYWCHCTKCYSNASTERTIEEAIAAWNRR